MASAMFDDCCDANRDAKDALLATAPVLYMPRLALPEKHRKDSFISQFPASGTRRSLGLPPKNCFLWPIILKMMGRSKILTRIT